MPAARVTLLTALDRIDAALKTERYPIPPERLAAEIEAARAAWPKWSPGHRYQARWDLEAGFEATLRYARANWATLVSAHKAGHLFDDGAYEHPSDYYRLPIERKAAAALNALRHASISRRMIADDIPHPRRPMTERATTVLRARIAQRRRDWQRFLQLLAEYRALKETAR